MELARGRPDDSVDLSPPLLLFPSAAAWDQVLNLRDKASSPFLPASSFHSFSLPSLARPISRFSLRCASFKSPLAALRCRLYPFSEPRPAPPGPKFSLKLRPGGNPKCLEIFHNSRPVVRRVRRVRSAHMLHLWHTKVIGVVRPICYSKLLQPTSIILARLPARAENNIRFQAPCLQSWSVACDGWMDATCKPHPLLLFLLNSNH